MSKWVLVPEGITEAVDAAKDFYELYKRTVVSGCTPMEQLRFVAALKFFESMLNAAPSPDKQPVAWYVFDKRTQKHWYTNKSGNTAGYYAKEYSHREADGSPSMLVVPLYTHPAADVQELVEALRRLEEVASDCDIGYMDNAVRHARVVLDKWEGK